MWSRKPAPASLPQRARRLLSPVLLLLAVAALLTLSASSPAVRTLVWPSAPGGAVASAAARAFRDGFHEAPQHPLNAGRILIQEATEEHTLTVIELHGLGAAAGELPFREALANAMPWVKWVAPQARTINVTVRAGAPTTAWFDIATFQDVYEGEDVEGIVESQREIHALIEQERQLLRDAGKEPRVAVAGFSQGAVLSLLSALTAREPLEAAILLSGFLPLADKAHLLASSVARETPVFWGHGHADAYLRANLAAQSVFALRQPPFALREIEYRTYDHLEHAWSLDELADLRAWALAKLPRERGQPPPLLVEEAAPDPVEYPF